MLRCSVRLGLAVPESLSREIGAGALERLAPAAGGPSPDHTRGHDQLRPMDVLL